MDAPLLSVCLIARDEAERLARCLAAVAPIADEIVLADTGSTDATPAIARENGARVIEIPWRDDFAAARNECLDAARGQWVLFVDADEVLAPTKPAPLQQKLRASTGPAFTVEVVSPHGRGRQEVAHITRLFRRAPEHRYEGRIHEGVLASICRALGRETWTPPRSGLRLTHEGYTPGLSASRGKRERNRRLLLAEIAERPDESGLRFLFARENAAAAGGDVLDLPETREALDVLAPAAEALLASPESGIADPALTLAIRLAVAVGDLPRAARWREGALQLLGQRTARICYSEGELLLARALAGPDLSAGVRDARRAFRNAREAREGCATLPTETEMREDWADARTALCGALLGERKDVERLAAAGTATRFEPLLVRAFAAAREGGAAQALPLLRDALQAEAQDPRGWWALGFVVRRLGDADVARNAAETALRAAPGWSAAEALRDGLDGPAPAGLLSAWTRL